MGGTRRCGSCGHEMPESSRVCLLCGRDVPAQRVELERLDDPAPGPDGDRAVADAGGGKRDRRAPLAIGAAVVVLLAVVVFLAGGDDGDADGSEGGSEEAAAEPTTTDAPSRPTRPSTTRPRPTTTTEPPPVTTISTLTPIPQPVLGEETGGLSLYIANGRSVVRVELDTGRVTGLLEAFRGQGFVHGLIVFDESVLVMRDNETYALPRDLSTVTEAVTRSDACCWQLGQQALAYGGGPNGMTVREVWPNGASGRQWELTGALQAVQPTAPIGDELLVQKAGRMYLVSEDRSVRHYAVGEFVGSRDTWIVWRSCDEQLSCRLHLGDPERPNISSVDIEANDIWASGYGLQLSPDGRSVVARDETGAVSLIDILTGNKLASIDPRSRVDWTPDGAWVFGRSNGVTNPHRRVVAISARDGREVEFDLPHEFDGQDVYFAVG